MGRESKLKVPSAAQISIRRGVYYRAVKTQSEVLAKSNFLGGGGGGCWVLEESKLKVPSVVKTQSAMYRPNFNFRGVGGGGILDYS